MDDFGLSGEQLAYIAGALFIIGYVTVNQVFLRCMVLIGTGFYIWYYTVVGPVPLWEAIYMSSLMGLANLSGLAQLLIGRTYWAVPRRHRDIYAHFPELPPGDFRNLMKRATRRILPRGAELTREDAPVDRLYYVIDGQLDVEKRGETFALPGDVFVGEVAYLTGRVSSATTWARTDLEVLEWRFDDIASASARHSRFKLALEAMISRDMALKLAFAVAPHQRDWDHVAAMGGASRANPLGQP